MNGIQWRSLEPGAVEDLLARLLVRVRPGAQRINGSGGDGGADVIHRAEDGLHVFEIKSFSGTLTNSQKAKISKSFATALTSWPEMVAWHLVMPMDPTPSGDQWLAQLAGLQPEVQMEWIGLAQIEVALADNPDLQRAFLPDSPYRLALDLMTTAEQERAALKGGLPDALGRFAGLGSLVTTLDPDYDFAVKTAPGMQEVAVLPKDPGSTARHPITVGFRLRAPAGTPEADAIESALTYGTGLELSGKHVVDLDLSSLPAGLGDATNGMRLQGLSLVPGTPEPQRILVTATKDGSRSRRTLTLTQATAGLLGGRQLVLRDDGGALSLYVPIEANGQSEGLSIRLSVAGLYPHDAADIVAFSVAFATADDIEMRFETGVSKLRLKSVDAHLLAQLEEMSLVIAAIDRVQAACATTFTLPAASTSEQIRDLLTLDRVLENGSADVPWIPGVATLDRATVRTLLANALVPRLRFTGHISSDQSVRFGESTFSLPAPLRVVGENMSSLTGALCVDFSRTAAT